MLKKTKIAIVGGGVAGSTTALHLGQLGLDVTLFEKESSLVSGPPFCHLHAGGNLYREISDSECITLLKQSIDFLNFYPFVVDYRPTVIVLPTTDKSTPSSLIPRLELLKKEYQALIDADSNNRVLGDSKEYYKLYDKKTLEKLKEHQPLSHPQTHDEWMIQVAKNIDFEKVQFPIIMVQEYGLNLFRLASGVKLALDKISSVTLYTQTEVTQIKREEQMWKITYKNKNKEKKEKFDYLINAAGFRTGKIDDMVNAPCNGMVEFKAAYISHWEAKKELIFPEIIFHGERGTPQGMGQFTPYPGGYFQLHGMTTQITLYEDGLVTNTQQSCQAKLGKNFIRKIEKDWLPEETKERTYAAIEHLAQFIPSFITANVGSKPLFGAQQIPGKDPTLRVAEVSFPLEYYARCEIVKVSSVIDMIKSIVENLIELNYLNDSAQNQKEFKIGEEKIHKYAQELSLMRKYPKSLASRNIAK